MLTRDDDREFRSGAKERSRSANCMQDAAQAVGDRARGVEHDRTTATSVRRTMGTRTSLVTLSAMLPMLLSGCIECGNEELARVPSPSGARDAVLFSRNCGATTGFNTQLQIVPSGREPAGASPLFALDGIVPVTLRWQNETSLTVLGVDRARVFRDGTAMDGVEVRYEP